MSAAQTTAPTGSMIGATFTAFVSMMTMSAFLPGVSEPVRSAMPATSAPPIVAQRRTWREVIRPGEGSSAVEVRVPGLLVLASRAPSRRSRASG